MKCPPEESLVCERTNFRSSQPTETTEVITLETIFQLVTENEQNYFLTYSHHQKHLFQYATNNIFL